MSRSDLTQAVLLVCCCGMAREGEQRRRWVAFLCGYVIIIVTVQHQFEYPFRSQYNAPQATHSKGMNTTKTKNDFRIIFVKELFQLCIFYTWLSYQLRNDFWMKLQCSWIIIFIFYAFIGNVVQDHIEILFQRAMMEKKYIGRRKSTIL